MLKHVIINNARIVAIKNSKILEHNKMNAGKTFKPYPTNAREKVIFFFCWSVAKIMPDPLRLIAREKWQYSVGKIEERMKM